MAKSLASGFGVRTADLAEQQEANERQQLLAELTAFISDRGDGKPHPVNRRAARKLTIRFNQLHDVDFKWKEVYALMRQNQPPQQRDGVMVGRIFRRPFPVREFFHMAWCH